MKIRNRIKELRHVKANELHPNSKNWRTHPKAQQDALKGILAEIGYADALLAREQADGSLVLVDGHLRAETTPEEEVPVLILDIDEAESDKLLLSLDPLAALAETNATALDSLLREVDTGSEGLQEMYADMADAADLYQDDAKEIEEDEVPEPPADPITQPGDLWTLGNHRLLCGDSTKKEDVDRLMGGAKADMVFTDPPYGMHLDADYSKMGSKTIKPGRKHDNIINDDADFDPAFIFSFFGYCNDILLFGADYYSDKIPRKNNGSWLIWDKRVEERYDTIIGSSFETIFSKRKVKREIIRCEYVSWASRTADVLNGKKPHPTMKPVKLIIIMLKKFQQFLIVDLFLGSGSTLIAAEQLNRKCYGMELSPQYCDVIVQRWETLTGQKAERQDANGKTRPTP